MKALEEEYEALQRKVWKATPKDTKTEDFYRLREIRREIGDESAKRIWKKILS